MTSIAAMKSVLLLGLSFTTRNEKLNLLEPRGLYSRMLESRPNMLYELRNLAFVGEEQKINAVHSQCTEISCGVFHAFFITECKNFPDTMTEAETRACSNNAALMSAARRFNALVEKPIYEGTNLQSFDFSLALTPSLASLHVHWAKVSSNSKVAYHMHQISSFDSGNEEYVKVLCDDMGSILD